jgi:hypothetical protein
VRSKYDCEDCVLVKRKCVSQLQNAKCVCQLQNVKYVCQLKYAIENWKMWSMCVPIAKCEVCVPIEKCEVFVQLQNVKCVCQLKNAKFLCNCKMWSACANCKMRSVWAIAKCELCVPITKCEVCCCRSPVGLPQVSNLSQVLKLHHCTNVSINRITASFAHYVMCVASKESHVTRCSVVWFVKRLHDPPWRLLHRWCSTPIG